MVLRKPIPQIRRHRHRRLSVNGDESRCHSKFAAGALLALTTRGIRIPEDVQVISWANKGLGPVFTRPLTRVEMDPKAHGETVARHILDHLENNPSAEREAVLAPTFIAGETTRSGVSRSRRPCATRTHGA